MKKTHFFSFTYFFLLIVLLSKSFLYDSYIFQLIVKILLFASLLAMYLTEVSKQKWNKWYLLMTVFVLLGQLFFVNPDPNSHFSYTLYLYFIAHMLLSFIVYDKYLEDKSFFDIFTFSLPFILSLSVIYVMIDKDSLDTWWEFRLISFAFVVCFNATIVLMNYIAKKNIRNYLIFIGVVIWLIVDLLSVIYVFNMREEIYYQIITVLDAVVQYLICRGFILNNSKGDRSFPRKRI